MNPSFINGSHSHKADPNSFWKWKGINTAKKKRSRQNSVTKFLQESSKKIEAAALGPGGGAGIGCGVGIGFGLVGGVGYGGGPWSHLRMAFGIGMGCGAGLGIGFGQGIGLGFSMDSLQSYLSGEKSDSNKRVLIPI
ncbi:hypothetical protein RHMOL_Rhmol10G0093000 [Rhododendron molle]|uniref:Uncharacterized protein n=1 Tax=Rhododendron molle TaxID=49168 RepID=A0ACC0M1P7_RHOML|nr:hypothetical protein RHMOL_Rhmol10G0093000 [Rhododendron molle]